MATLAFIACVICRGPVLGYVRRFLDLFNRNSRVNFHFYVSQYALNLESVHVTYTTPPLGDYCAKRVVGRQYLI